MAELWRSKKASAAIQHLITGYKMQADTAGIERLYQVTNAYKTIDRRDVPIWSYVSVFDIFSNPLYRHIVMFGVNDIFSVLFNYQFTNSYKI